MIKSVEIFYSYIRIHNILLKAEVSGPRKYLQYRLPNGDLLSQLRAVGRSLQILLILVTSEFISSGLRQWLHYEVHKATHRFRFSKRKACSCSSGRRSSCEDCESYRCYKYTGYKCNTSNDHGGRKSHKRRRIQEAEGIFEGYFRTSCSGDEWLAFHKHHATTRVSRTN